MHKPVRDHLEAFLSKSNDSGIPEEFHAHLAACPSCQDDLGALAGQSEQLRAFRDTTQREPRAGFYSRVLNRIDEQKPDSFWSVFLGPVLGGRLAYSCAALVLVLGTYLVTSERADQDPQPDVITSQLPRTQVENGTARPPDRDAVLVNLVSYQE